MAIETILRDNEEMRHQSDLREGSCSSGLV